MLGKSLAILVVSPRENSGTSLIARLFTEFFKLSGSAPLLFDTDAIYPKFSKFFPEAELVDLSSTKGQMRLFDTLPVNVFQPKIVDISHRAFSAFFTLMRDIDFIREARQNRVEPVIVYVPHYQQDDFERGFRIREHFSSEFILAENAYLGEAPPSLHSVDAYWALKAHPVRMMIPKLDMVNMSLLEDTRVSMVEFMKASAPGSPAPQFGDRKEIPLAYLSLDARSKIRNWLRTSLREAQRVVHLAQTRIDTPLTDVGDF